VFRFTRFSLFNEHSPHRIGTDSVLLGAWLGARIEVDRPIRAADLGSGTGVLSCLIADRFRLARVDLYEQDAEACREFEKSAQQLPFADRLKLLAGDFKKSLPENKPELGYDLVVSNPPYFARSLMPQRSERRNARHFDGENERREWFELAAASLAIGGTLAWIEPAESDPPDFLSAFGLFRSRLLWVKGLESKPRIRRIEEWVRVDSRAAPIAIEENELSVWRGKNIPSDAYKNLLRGFLPSLSDSSEGMDSIRPN
jgi:tRNA1Val (adenine37-N6)-methyltransferase